MLVVAVQDLYRILCSLPGWLACSYVLHVYPPLLHSRPAHRLAFRVVAFPSVPCGRSYPPVPAVQRLRRLLELVQRTRRSLPFPSSPVPYAAHFCPRSFPAPRHTRSAYAAPLCPPSILIAIPVYFSHATNIADSAL
ncbi:hypothetical protein B0H12DRAFT_1239331 [Mycena haematopus]|nr:hypothetical protein B0H12DRAFT_1239331 [Mycena haematopus]